MEQSDIREIVKLLNSSIKTQDWDIVEEAVSYLKDYLDETCVDEDLD